MEPKPDDVEEATSPVEAGVTVPDTAPAKVARKKKATTKAKKVLGKRTKATARKRPRKAAKSVVKPVLSRKEIVEQLSMAKDEFKEAVAEPVMNLLGRYSGMVRDGFYGAWAGFIGSKKRAD